MRNQNEATERKSNGGLIVLGFILILLFAGMGYMMGVGVVQTNTTSVENVFADVNGDGMPDLILNGTVILNTGQTNF